METMLESLENAKIVDLTVELVSRLTRLNGSIEEGTRDVYNMPWIAEETVNERDGTIELSWAPMLGQSQNGPSAV